MQGWQLAREKAMSDAYDLLILDELTYLVDYKLVAEEEVLKLISQRPERLNLVITGRNASKGLCDAADLVTEMQEIKHPFKQGVSARKGLEY